MFSTGHFIWIAVSFILIGVFTALCIRFKPPVKRVITVCLALGLLSEVIKILSVIEIVPMVDPAIVNENGTYVLTYVPTGEYSPMLANEHLPLELCSLQLFFMALLVILKDERLKHYIYVLMFPTGVIGGTLGVVLATTTNYIKTPSEFITSPRIWQYFIYHAMIIFLSIYIGYSKEIYLKFKDWKPAVIAVILLDLPSFYINSVMSEKVYLNNELVGTSHRINYLSSYVNPLGIVLKEKWQWIIYLLIRAVLAFGLIVLLFVPFIKRKKERSLGEHKQA
ncbi:MAG: YwaF family protein [Clostridiales bacterium]|nr:YwaF family protein [Clostridiales bacterium]